MCLSLLGKETGASVAGSDKWDPEKSSLWQVHSVRCVVVEPRSNICCFFGWETYEIEREQRPCVG